MQKPFPPVLPKRVYPVYCECTIDMLKGNLQSIKRHHVANIQSEVRLLSLKRTTWKQARDILASEIGLQLIKVNTLSVINHLFICFDMQQFVLVPASMYNKSLIT